MLAAAALAASTVLDGCEETARAPSARASAWPPNPPAFATGPSTRGAYLAALANGELFSALACYCGCDETAGHRNLRDCFIRQDGAWEEHGAGCGVCVAEAAEAMRLQEAGVARLQIAAQITKLFSPMRATTPPSKAAG